MTRHGADVHVRPGVQSELTGRGPPRRAGGDLLARLLDHEVVVRTGTAHEGHAPCPGGHLQPVRFPRQHVRPHHRHVRIGQAVIPAAASGQTECDAASGQTECDAEERGQDAQPPGPGGPFAGRRGHGRVAGRRNGARRRAVHGGISSVVCGSCAVARAVCRPSGGTHHLADQRCRADQRCLEGTEAPDYAPATTAHARARWHAPEGTPVFESVLIANRGEIAVRIARGCRELGVRAVAVYSEADREALHVRTADEAHLIGPAAPASSYLDIARIVETARRAGVDAVHPGYGFLAENAAFARAVADAGMAFIGPSPEAIERMGDKLSARAVARAADVPVVPGTVEPTDDPDVATAFGDEHGYPVAVKAMFGGGGRGMKVVRDASQMRDALAAAAREAGVAFGRTECYLERYLERPRHVEVQVLGDLDGTVIHLGDRDCSLQRRHQKLIEEAPAPSIDPAVRARIHEAAVRVSREMRYVSAGTCEFLLDEDGQRFYFLEMNTRLQVEHPVTELVTGVDLVHAQLRIASGEGLGMTQDDVVLRGHAIEVRVNAEDPAAGFVPSPGTVSRLEAPLGPGVRLDTGVRSGGEIPREYDSMIAELIVWGADRDVACRRMRAALDDLVVEGVPTTVPFHRLALEHPMFLAAEHATSSVEREWDLSSLPAARVEPNELAPDVRRREDLVTVEVNDRRFEVRVVQDVRIARAPRRDVRGGRGGAASGATVSGELLAPMQGTVIGYAVEPGAQVSAGDPVVTIEAMKMENTLRAPVDGVVISTGVAPGTVVQPGALLATIEPA